VRNGTGVGVLVHDAVQDQISRNEFGILKIKGICLTAKTYILWHKEKPLSKNAQDFLTLLRVWRLKNHESQSLNSEGLRTIVKILHSQEAVVEHG
jgi:DNA-binding transcriptional LysR family regulator